MDIILKRIAFRKDGIFSDLLDDQGNQLFQTLEHAYLDDNGIDFKPKIPDGSYQCARGIHKLAGMIAPFETFEITGVFGHTNILFHVGNYNDDSEGCVLVGTEINASSSTWFISKSRDAFDDFMFLQKEVNSFTLVVTSI